MRERESYRELILENIEYDYLIQNHQLDRDRLDELVELMVDTVCSNREMIRIAHGAGFAVMAHANGSQAVLAAAEAGVDSVEHGAYLSGEALEAMAEAGTVWVPTLATIGNLRGTGRFSEADVTRILTSAQENVARFHALGGLLAPGSDAGAYAVFHGQGGLDEYRLLSEALGPEAGDALSQGISAIRQRF